MTTTRINFERLFEYDFTTQRWGPDYILVKFIGKPPLMLDNFAVISMSSHHVVFTSHEMQASKAFLAQMNLRPTQL